MNWSYLILTGAKRTASLKLIFKMSVCIACSVCPPACEIKELLRKVCMDGMQ